MAASPRMPGTASSQPTGRQPAAPDRNVIEIACAPACLAPAAVTNQAASLQSSTVSPRAGRSTCWNGSIANRARRSTHRLTNLAELEQKLQSPSKINSGPVAGTGVISLAYQLAVARPPSSAGSGSGRSTGATAPPSAVVRGQGRGRGPSPSLAPPELAGDRQRHVHRLPGIATRLRHLEHPAGQVPGAAGRPFTMLVPVVGMVTAGLVLHEVPTTLEVAGGVLLLGGVAAAVLLGRRSRSTGSGSGSPGRTRHRRSLSCRSHRQSAAATARGAPTTIPVG